MSEYDLWWRVSSGLLFNEFKSRNSKLMEMNVPVKMFISERKSVLRCFNCVSGQLASLSTPFMKYVYVIYVKTQFVKG